MMCAIVMIALFVACGLPTVASCMDALPVTCGYSIIIDGKDAGDMTIIRRPGDDDAGGIRGDVWLRLRIADLWASYDLYTAERVWLGREGIERFEHRIVENGDGWCVSGQRIGDALQCRACRDQACADTPEDDLIRRIPIDGFDTCRHGLPAFMSAMDVSRYKTKVHVLDTTELEIKPYVIQRIGMESLWRAGRVLACAIFSVRTPEGQSVYWIAEDSLGALLVKEKGIDSDQSYEVILKSIRADTAAG